MTTSTFALNSLQISLEASEFLKKEGSNIADIIINKLKEARDEYKSKKADLTVLPTPSDIIITAGNIGTMQDAFKQIGRMLLDYKDLPEDDQFKMNAGAYEFAGRCITIQHENLRIAYKNLLENYASDTARAKRILCYASSYVPRVLSHALETRMIDDATEKINTVINASQNIAKAHYALAAFVATYKDPKAENTYEKYLGKFFSFLSLAMDGREEDKNLNAVEVKDSDTLANIVALMTIATSASFVVPFVVQFFTPNKE